jgi:hypothetical protein
MSTDKVNPPAAGASPKWNEVRQIFLSSLRQYGAKDLRALMGAAVVKDRQGVPLAVVMPYSAYMEMQSALEDALKQLHEHDSEYHHQTPADLLVRIERILPPALPPVAEKT